MERRILNGGGAPHDQCGLAVGVTVHNDLCVTGQAGAVRLGIARALADLDPEMRVPLKKAGLLTRDARSKESKKYGLKKARKAPQYTKR